MGSRLKLVNEDAVKPWSSPLALMVTMVTPLAIWPMAALKISALVDISFVRRRAPGGKQASRGGAKCAELCLHANRGPVALSPHECEHHGQHDAISRLQGPHLEHPEAQHQHHEGHEWQ